MRRMTSLGKRRASGSGRGCREMRHTCLVELLTLPGGGPTDPVLALAPGVRLPGPSAGP